MKIRPTGQGIEPPAESPVQGTRTGSVRNQAGKSVPPPTDGCAGVANPARPQLAMPVGGRADATILPALLGKLQSPPVSPAAFVDRLRRLAGQSSSRAVAVETMATALNALHGSRRLEGMQAWIRAGEWEPDERLAGVRLLTWVSERLGDSREPLAERLTARFAAAGLDELEAAHQGWRVAGILQAVQLVWEQGGGKIDDAGAITGAPGRRLVSERISAEAREVLKRYLPPVSSGPLRL